MRSKLAASWAPPQIDNSVQATQCHLLSLCFCSFSDLPASLPAPIQISSFLSFLCQRPDHLGALPDEPRCHLPKEVHLLPQGALPLSAAQTPLQGLLLL